MQLIHAETDTHLWAKSYERALRDVLDLQSEVARAIADEIKVKITPEQRASLGRARAVDPAVYTLYLKGRHHWNQLNEEGCRKALTCFEQALAMDLAYAPAHVGVASCGLNPGSAAAHLYYAWFLNSQARLDEATDEVRRAHALDPLSLVINTNLAYLGFFARQYEQAIQHACRTLDLDPDYTPGHWVMGWPALQLGRHDEAIEAFRGAMARGTDVLYRTSLAYACAVAGPREEASRLLSELSELSARRYVPAGGIARVYVGFQQFDQAIVWLTRALEQREPEMAYLRVDPTFDPLRADLRFQALVRRMNFPA